MKRIERNPCQARSSIQHIHAYICDLRGLPYEEQLHWVGYNEDPKGSIATRAYINDFEGQFIGFTEAPAEILRTMQRRAHEKTWWWRLRDEKLLGQLNTPLTASRDEWAESLMDLAKLVVEGFEIKPLRLKLDECKVAYTIDDKTISLMEKALNASSVSGVKLDGLRLVQHLRSKVKGHAGGEESARLAREAIAEHETYGGHFKHVCQLVLDDLGSIEAALSPSVTQRPGVTPDGTA